MDHISANKTLPVTERENISGARVFDGEDQGKFRAQPEAPGDGFRSTQEFLTLDWYRCWQQVPNAAVTADGLVRAADQGEAAEEAAGPGDQRPV